MQYQRVCPRLGNSPRVFGLCRPAAKRLALCCLALTPPTWQEDAVEGQASVEPDIRACVKWYFQRISSPELHPCSGRSWEDRIKERVGSFWRTRELARGKHFDTRIVVRRASKLLVIAQQTFHKARDKGKNT